MRHVSFLNECRIDRPRVEKVRRGFQRALVTFPHLHEVPIVVRLCEIHDLYSMQVRPCLKNFMRGRRVWHILVSAKYNAKTGINVTALREPILQGWFAHEISHIHHWHPLPTWKLVHIACMQLVSPQFVRELEHQTDRVAARHNARQLRQGVEYVLTHPRVTEAYRERTQRYYTSPEQITTTSQI